MRDLPLCHVPCLSFDVYCCCSHQLPMSLVSSAMYHCLSIHHIIFLLGPFEQSNDDCCHMARGIERFSGNQTFMDFKDSSKLEVPMYIYCHRVTHMRTHTHTHLCDPDRQTDTHTRNYTHIHTHKHTHTCDSVRVNPIDVFWEWITTLRLSFLLLHCPIWTCLCYFLSMLTRIFLSYPVYIVFVFSPTFTRKQSTLLFIYTLLLTKSPASSHLGTSM